jgi:hypothetical protein
MTDKGQQTPSREPTTNIYNVLHILRHHLDPAAGARLACTSKTLHECLACDDLQPTAQHRNDLETHSLSLPTSSLTRNDGQELEDTLEKIWDATTFLLRTSANGDLYADVVDYTLQRLSCNEPPRYLPRSKRLQLRMMCLVMYSRGYSQSIHQNGDVSYAKNIRQIIQFIDSIVQRVVEIEEECFGEEDRAAFRDYIRRRHEEQDSPLDSDMRVGNELLEHWEIIRSKLEQSIGMPLSPTSQTHQDDTETFTSDDYSTRYFDSYHQLYRLHRSQDDMDLLLIHILRVTFGTFSLSERIDRLEGLFQSHYPYWNRVFCGTQLQRFAFGAYVNNRPDAEPCRVFHLDRPQHAEWMLKELNSFNDIEQFGRIPPNTVAGTSP